MMHSAGEALRAALLEAHHSLVTYLPHFRAWTSVASISSAASALQSITHTPLTKMPLSEWTLFRSLRVL